MSKNLITEWDKDSGVSTCTLRYRSNNDVDFLGHGIAVCHENDQDFKSELTGAIIAEYRAEIDVCRKIRDYELRPGLMALKHVLGTMVKSKHFNPKSYEAKRLMKEIHRYKEEIEDTNKLIAELQLNLKAYIDGKDAIYRERRAEAKNK